MSGLPSQTSAALSIRLGEPGAITLAGPAAISLAGLMGDQLARAVIVTSPHCHNSPIGPAIHLGADKQGRCQGSPSQFAVRSN